MIKEAIQLIVVLGSVLALLLLSGCLNPPAGYVEYDTDGDGQPNAYAIDQDKDGVITEADYVDGEPVLIKESLVKATVTADSIVPEVLGIAGSVTGLSILSAIGIFLKKLKGGKMFRDTILAVQVFRDRLKEKNESDTLREMNQILDENLAERSKVEIEKVKESVT